MVFGVTVEILSGNGETSEVDHGPVDAGGAGDAGTR